ncbi:MAG: ABC transporter permease, partial [Candidatus Thorarchaeota archaeon]
MNPNKMLKYAVLSLPFIILIIFLVYPVAAVIIQGLLFGPGSSFIEVVSSQVSYRVFMFTFSQAILSTALALVLGIPGALIISKLRFRGKSTIRALLTIPFVLPPIVVVVGFLQVFGTRGILDSLLMMLTNSSESLLNLATGYLGIILAHAFYNIPLFLLMVSASLERLDPQLEEAAEILGASPIYKFRKVTFPHIRSSIAAASVLTFLFCFMSFPIVLALGEGHFITLEVQIWNAFRFFDYGEAASLALVQLLITVCLAYLYFKSGDSDQNTAGQTAYIKTVSFSDLSKKYRALILVYAILIVMLVIGPMVSIIRSAIYDPNTNSYTMRGFENLLNPGIDGAFIPMVNSVFYAGLATLFSVILGLLIAYARKSDTRMLPELSSMITLLPLGVSAITIAYG